MLLLLLMCRPAALLCSARSPDPLGQAAQQHFKSAIQRMDSSNVLLLLMHCSDDYAEEQSAVLSLGLLGNFAECQDREAPRNFEIDADH
jgi:hypothetical protein